MLTIDLQKPWCVFTHTVEDKPIYIGFDRTARAFNIHLISQIAKWQDAVKANGNKVDVAVFMQYATRQEAQEAWRTLIAVMKPTCNIHRGIRGNPHKQKVICTTDHNREFESVSAAARYYSISQSALSNHINGRVGYNTVHGHTFMRQE